jgi:hypothetical protein
MLVLKNLASMYGRIFYGNLRQSFVQFTRHTGLFTWRLKAASLSSNYLSKFLFEITTTSYATSLFMGIVALEIRAEYPSGTDLEARFNMLLVWK